MQQNRGGYVPVVLCPSFLSRLKALRYMDYDFFSCTDPDDLTNTQRVPLLFHINNLHTFFCKRRAVIFCGYSYRKRHWLHFCEIVQVQRGFVGVYRFGDLGLVL